MAQDFITSLLYKYEINNTLNPEVQRYILLQVLDNLDQRKYLDQYSLCVKTNHY